MKKILLIALFTTAILSAKAQSADSTLNDAKKANDVFATAEVSPEPVGGYNAFYHYVLQSIRYPVYSREHRISGRVIVSFIVEKDGSLSDLKVIRSVSEDIDAEAIRIIENAPKWVPGRQNGKPVRVLFTLPLQFSIK